MSIRVATYNIEWFNNCFDKNNTLKLDQSTVRDKLSAVRDVLQLIKADVIGIVEAPNTTATSGIQDTVVKLENFANWAGLSTSKAAMGFRSRGVQEIAMLYDPNKMNIMHKPGGQENSRSNPPFDDEFFYDADDDGIKEVYKHYRPPFEAEIALNNGQTFYAICVHIKSKGIFSAVDSLHWERENRRNRLKLYAECAWVRRRVQEWLEADRPFVVLGDFNDGPGLDEFEMRFGRSAIEIIMGDLFEPDKILRNFLGKPKWNKSFGWTPSSARFRHKITESYINVWIDHILASPNLPVSGDPPAQIWNPFLHDDLDQHINLFLTASDHFPLTLDVDF